jgi:acyl-CoA thioester hydrolase
MIDLNKLDQAPKTTYSRVVIRFQDCDPLRHLNNAKYFDYFFNAREDQVPKLYHVEVMDFINAFKAAWVVYQHHIAYIRPANVGEWVSIFTRVIGFSDDAVAIEYVMTNDDVTELKTVLWAQMKYVDIKTGRRTSHPALVTDYLRAICLPVENLDLEHFNSRIKEIKEELPILGAHLKHTRS